jgi:hypothetical protein
MKKAVYDSDKIGVASSIICIIHCAIPPLLFTVATGLGNYIEKYFHTFAIDLIFFLIAAIAVFFSSRNTSKYYMRIALWVCLLFFGAGIFLNSIIENAEYIIYLGSFGLIIAHTINHKWYKSILRVRG